MSMGSFSASLAGLSANQQKLGVIGNNLANINTIGFKSSTVTFADLVSQSVSGTSENPMQIGLGVTTGSISPNFSQGGIENTGIATNVAIQGNGFFVIGTPGSSQMYTRAGNFSFDSSGMLATAEGQAVLGYTTPDPVTGAIVTTGQPGNIVVPPGVLRAPSATTQFSTVTNLNAGAAANATFTTVAPIFDALGVAHSATITYTNTAPGAWAYSITVPGADVGGGAAGAPSQIAAGTLAFDGSGTLTAVNGGAVADVTVTSPAWANGAAATDFTWSLLDANGAPRLSGYSSPSATSSITQNGTAAGSIDHITINASGALVASFGAGQTVTVGQLAMANFNNPQGLVKLGSNNFSESQSSGIANVGVAGTGGRGTLIGSSLEQSNVDIAQEFTQMILAQRGYQANSKGITVSDEILVDTLNIIR